MLEAKQSGCGPQPTTMLHTSLLLLSELRTQGVRRFSVTVLRHLLVRLSDSDVPGSRADAESRAVAFHLIPAICCWSTEGAAPGCRSELRHSNSESDATTVHSLRP